MSVGTKKKAESFKVFSFFNKIWQKLTPYVWHTSEITELGLQPLGEIPNYNGPEKTNLNLHELLKPTAKANNNDIFIQRALLKSSYDKVASEAFLKLQNQITNKSTSVLTPSYGNGSSFFAANLARAFSESGHKTLLIDCDFRRPNISNSIRAQGLFGMIDLIESDHPEVFNDYIFHLPCGLDILPAGHYYPGASKLLAHKNFHKVVKSLENKYDRIVLDLPPLTKVTEAYHASNTTDYGILLVTLGHCKIFEIKDTIIQLLATGTKDFGYVINRTDRSERGLNKNKDKIKNKVA